MKSWKIALKPAREKSREKGPEEQRDEYSSSIAGELERNKLVFFEGKRYSFDLEDLLRASAEVLGKGSVGTAYKAVLEDGTILAVKRLKDVTTGRKEFETQIEIVGKLQHRNLVPLRAYYFSKDEKLLVYDYMPMGSLSALLHGKDLIHHTNLFVEGWSPVNFHRLFCLQYHGSLSTCRAFSDVVFAVEGKATYFRSLKAKLILAPPHYLQVCTENLPKMERGVGKSPNYRPNVELRG